MWMRGQTRCAMPTPAKPCPNCGKPAKEGFAPFCCKRCQQVDLHRWFAGTYAIPAEESDEMSDDDDGDREI